jgi:hypothetical protein
VRVALLGPRGLSALLLVLLPVFAGMPGAERLFAITSLTVLLSVVLHGGGIALLMRRDRRRLTLPPADGGAPRGPFKPLGITSTSDVPALATPAPNEAVRAPVTDEGLPTAERISVEEVRSLRERGIPYTPVDVRAPRSYRAAQLQAAGAVRLPPDDPVGAAEALRLPRDATLLLYCA